MLLIGATGKVGKHLVPVLVAAGERPTVLVRDVDRAFEALGGSVEYVVGDLKEPATVQAAAAGHDVVYLANGQNDEQVELETNAIDGAVAAGVARIVKISAMGAAPDGTNSFARWHGAIEAYLATTPLVSTILRPNMFDDNLLGSAGQIAAGQLFSTTEDGRLAFVDPKDIAEVAAAALLDDSHAGKVYDGTGPEAVSYDELAQRFTTALGRPVQHIRIDDASFRGALEGFGLPAWVITAYVELNAGVRNGLAAAVSGDVPAVLGRPAISIDAWIKENEAAFTA